MHICNRFCLEDDGGYFNVMLICEARGSVEKIGREFCNYCLGMMKNNFSI